MKYLRTLCITAILTLFASASFGEHANPGLDSVSKYIGATTLQLRDGSALMCQKPAYGPDGSVVDTPGMVGDVDVIWYCFNSAAIETPWYCFLQGLVKTTDGGIGKMWACSSNYHKLAVAFERQYHVAPNNPVDEGRPA